MRRVLLALATIAVLSLAGSRVEAGGYHHGHGGYGHHGSYYGARVYAPSPWVARPVIVPAPVYGYAPPCNQHYYPYYPAQSYGLYYQGRGLSIGVWF